MASNCQPESVRGFGRSSVYFSVGRSKKRSSSSALALDSLASSLSLFENSFDDSKDVANGITLVDIILDMDLFQLLILVLCPCSNLVLVLLLIGTSASFPVEHSSRARAIVGPLLVSTTVSQSSVTIEYKCADLV